MKIISFWGGFSLRGSGVLGKNPNMIGISIDSCMAQVKGDASECNSRLGCILMKVRKQNYEINI